METDTANTTDGYDEKFMAFLQMRGVQRVSSPDVEDSEPESNSPPGINFFDFLHNHTTDDADDFYVHAAFTSDNSTRVRLLGSENITDVLGADSDEDSDNSDGSIHWSDSTSEFRRAEANDGVREPGLDFDCSYHPCSPKPTPISSKITEIYMRYMTSNVHDEKLREILRDNKDEELIDSYNRDFEELASEGISQYMLKQPAEKYRQHLELDFIGKTELSNHEFVRKFKNNLSVIIGKYLVTAVSSEIVIHEFDMLTHLPVSQPILKFDTKPHVTTTSDRLISTWSYFPHTINHLKCGSWLGEQALGLCLDDGRIMIYHWESILSNLKYGRSSVPLKIHSDYNMKLESSAWGLDFLDYTVNGVRFNLLVTSDNSQSVTLFVYSEFDKHFYHIKSHQLLHNIPDVSFMSHSIDDPEETKHSVDVSCSSISGELVIFNFKFQEIQGPVNKPEIQDPPPHNRNATNIYYVDPTMDHLDNETSLMTSRMYRYFFEDATVRSRVFLMEDAWTSIPCSSHYFMPVDSLLEVFGRGGCEPPEGLSLATKSIDIIKESLAFEDIKDEDYSLGVSTKFQFYECPITSLSGRFMENPGFTKLTSYDDDYRRIHKIVKAMEIGKEKGEEPSINHQFLLVSTSARVGIFNEFLFSNCHTNELFELPMQFSGGIIHTNRISITHLIPEISAYIAISQIGIVSVFRLTQHRGIYGMRQELVFPNTRALAVGPNGYRTISGLAVKDSSSSPECPRFLLYLTYTDGLVLCYQLSDTFVDI